MSVKYKSKPFFKNRNHKRKKKIALSQSMAMAGATLGFYVPASSSSKKRKHTSLPPSPWRACTGIPMARDYYGKELSRCVEIFHFRFAKRSPNQGCLLWPPNLNLYPAIYSIFPAQSSPQAGIINFWSWLFSLFLARLNALWVHRSCLFCFHSISSPWLFGKEHYFSQDGTGSAV